MMRLNLKSIISLFSSLLITSQFVWSAEALLPGCGPLHISDKVETGPGKYDKGLLWKVSKEGKAANYIFGTVHMADKDILNIPPVITESLKASRIFIMEAVPDINNVLLIGTRMYFRDGRRLDELLPGSIYNRTIEILGKYNLTADSVSIMKPWAAFLTMNYPPETGIILDLDLLRIARENNAEVHGLETLAEQIDVLDSLDYDSQVTLLRDAVCHYNIIEEEFILMKKLYLERDLKGLFEISSRLPVTDAGIYEELMERLLTRRNYKMINKLQEFLEQGGAFIAVGAMHLPGEEGILQLLKIRKYDVTVVY